MCHDSSDGIRDYEARTMWCYIRIIQSKHPIKQQLHIHHNSIYITSIAKNTPAIGALKPAATPAAAPALSRILFL